MHSMSKDFVYTMKGLGKSYGPNKVILKDIYLSFYYGAKIGVIGLNGAGKSTLTGMLSRAFGWTPFYEANAENPYLSDFYQDMQRWSFHSQVFFLGKRLEHHHQLLAHPGSVVQDRTVYEDAEIFASTVLGMSRDEYYAMLCHASDSISESTGMQTTAPAHSHSEGGCGCGGGCRSTRP